MLEVAHDVGEAVDVVGRLQAGRFRAGRRRHDARQLPGVDVEGPEEVVDVQAAVLADEQSAQLLGELDVVRVGDFIRMGRSEEHTSELQSLMRISYAVFCLKKKNKKNLIYIYYVTKVNK